MDPAARIVTANRSDRCQRRDRHRADHGKHGAAEDRDHPRKAEAQRDLALGSTQRAKHRGVPRGPADQLYQTLPHQDEHREPGDGAENAQCDRLRHDGLLHLFMHRIGAPDAED
jgi:hypothetical protein